MADSRSGGAWHRSEQAGADCKRNMRELSGVMEGWWLHMRTRVKMHLTTYLKWEHCIACKLSLHKVHFFKFLKKIPGTSISQKIITLKDEI